MLGGRRPLAAQRLLHIYTYAVVQLERRSFISVKLPTLCLSHVEVRTALVLSTFHGFSVETTLLYMMCRYICS